MANTFSQIYIHIIFAVEGRRALIDPEWEEELYKYITGTVQKKGQKMLAINGIPNHIHILIGMTPDCRLSDVVREIKKSSNQFINQKHYISRQFKWQKGYGAFSYNHRQLDIIIKYIRNQKQHHEEDTFREEYLKLLDEYYVDYDPKYIFS